MTHHLPFLLIVLLAGCSVPAPVTKESLPPMPMAAIAAQDGPDTNVWSMPMTCSASTQAVAYCWYELSGSLVPTNELISSTPAMLLTNLPCLDAARFFFGVSQVNKTGVESPLSLWTFSGRAMAHTIQATGLCYTATSIIGPWATQINYFAAFTNAPDPLRFVRGMLCVTERPVCLP